MCIFKSPAKAVQQAAQAQVASQQEIAAAQAQSAKETADAQAAAEQQRQDQVNQGMSSIASAFGGFNDDFYNSRAKAYSDFAAPQVDDQYAQAKKALEFALADAGTTNSSAAADRLGRLERDYTAQKQTVANTAQGYADQARSQVSSARTGVANDLLNASQVGGSVGSATTASNSAGTQAAQQAASLAALPQFSALGQVFQNVASGIGTARATAQNNAILQNAALYPISSKGSGQTVSV